MNATVMASATAWPEIEHVDFELEVLCAALVALDGLEQECPDTDAFRLASLIERQWHIRSRIEEFQAQSIVGLACKARAAASALRLDPDVEQDCPGSFRELCKSLCVDAIRLGGAS
jgi:hypothetical protein